MTSRRMFGPRGLALAVVLGVFAAQPAAAEPQPAAARAQPAAARPQPAAPGLSRADAPSRPRRAVRAEAPLPPLCDGAGPSQIRRIQFNHAELEDPGAVPALQSAVQLCINAAPVRDRSRLLGPVWRG